MTQKSGKFPVEHTDTVLSFNLKAVALGLFLGVLLFQLAFLKPGIWGVDGNDMLNMSQSLITRGDFTVPAGSGGILGPDGQYYSIRYPLLPIFAVPFVAAGLTIGNALNLPTQYTSATCALVLNIVLTAATTVLVYRLALQLGAQRRGAYWAAVGYAFGTTALVYAREFFAEPLLSFLMTLALCLALSRSRRLQLGTSLLSALVIVAKPAGILLGPVISLYFLIRREVWWRVVLPCVGSGVGVGLYLLYNYVRFGSFTSSGQDASQFGLEGFFMRALGQLVSPGAGGGLFWYCPPTLLALVGLWLLWQKQKPAFVLVFGLIASFWLLHSGWAFNGWNWGPRFLVPILPALMATVGLLGRRWRMPLIGLIVLGFLVNAPTLVAFYQRYYAEVADLDTDVLMQTLELWSDPAQAPLFNVWSATFRQLQAALSTPVQEILSGAGNPPAPGEMAKAELLRIVAVWWWFLPAAGIPTWVGGAIALAMVGGSGWWLRQSWQKILQGYRRPAKLGQPG
ncbi:MAG: hypothetical protein F6J97_09000 [Leptolyngbya sp. SIO4C1]|nr:hypothetical protein [Leptolyngbya sp. SIO4C1]